MDSFPIAGQVLNEEIWNGVNAREAAKLFVIPVLMIGIGVSFQLPPELYWGAALLLAGTSGITLLVTPGGQSSFEYGKAILDYYFTRNTFYNRHARPEHTDDGMVKDESLVRAEYSDTTDLIVASQQDELLDDNNQ